MLALVQYDVESYYLSSRQNIFDRLDAKIQSRWNKPENRAHSQVPYLFWTETHLHIMNFYKPWYFKP